MPTKRPRHSSKWFMSRTMSAAFLIALSFVIVGCSKKDGGEFAAMSRFDDHRTSITKHVADPDKKFALLAIVEEMDMEFRSMDTFMKKHDVRVRKLINNYDTAREDFAEATSDFNERYKAFHDKLLENRASMVELTTPEEWDAISKLDKTSLY